MKRTGIIVLVLGIGIFLAMSLFSNNTRMEDDGREVSLVNEYVNTANDGGELNAEGQTEVQVSIGDFIFEPTRLTVSVDTTVSWINNDSVRHNVVSWDQSPNQGLSSDLLATGGSYSFTFTEPGEYVYFCEPHPFQMRGIVTVVE